MGKVNVSGVGINYEKAGTGHHTVLCMPGAMGSALSDFGPQLRSLAGAELTLVAWDPPGYGASRPPARSFGSDFFRDDARAAADLMQELGHDKYSVLGWSDGGNSAVILAAERPENVTKLVIWGANAFVTDEDIRLYEAVRDIDQWSEKMRAPMLELYGEDYFRSTWNAWVDAISAFKEKKNGICRREAAMVRCPTLVLHGAKDAMVGPAPRVLQQTHPRRQAARVPGRQAQSAPALRRGVQPAGGRVFEGRVSGPRDPRGPMSGARGSRDPALCGKCADNRG